MRKLSSLFVLVLVVAMLPLAATAQQAPATVDLAGGAEPAAPGAPVAYAAPEAVLYDNGPLVTHPGACGGMDASRLQTDLGMNTLGFGHQWPLGYRMADDFEVPNPAGWNVDNIQFFAYQSSAPSNPSPITGVYYQIWDGSPDDPGSSVVFGDLVTNRLVNSAFSNIQRDSGTSPCANNRYIFEDTASAGVTLPQGTYWLDWATDGNPAYSGPWAPPVTILGQTTTGNALQYTGAWAPALDTGTSTQQGMPFRILGTPGGGGDPDIQVNPTSLSAEQCQDTVTTQTLQICNVGGSDLTWSLGEVPAPKAPAGQARGVAARRSVELTLDAAGGGSVATNPPMVDAPVSLVLDDGTRENDIGIGGTWEMIWVNRFTPSPSEFPFNLTQVQVYFSSVGMVNVGDQMILAIYENTSGNYDPAVGSNLLATFDVAVQAVNAWNVYDLPAPVTLNGPGDVAIGVIALEVPGTSYWPASMDQTTTQQRSWAGWWLTSPPPDPPLLPPDDSWILIDDYFPGNWMLRGYGETGGAADIPWLSEDPTSGIIPAGDCVDVTVTFDSTGLVPGDYFGDLLIDSNDPDEPQVGVPVQLTVVDCNLYPDIDVTPTSLYAEQCPDTVTEQTLSICNVGGSDLTWSLTEAAPKLGDAKVILPARPEAPGNGTAAGAILAQPEGSYTVQRRAGTNAPPNVLLVYSDYGATAIQALLQAYGDLATVDLFDAQVATPTLAELQAYDVVLTWSNYVYADPVGIGNVLADYVDAGGKVINLMFAMGNHGWQMQGRFMDEGYTAMNGTSLYFGSVCLGSYNAGHPIMAGVTDVCEYFRMTGTYLTAGSTEIAQWADGLSFVAAKDEQTVVSINGYVGDIYQWTGQMPDVVHNAILWLAVPAFDAPWLSENPTSGTVLPGECADVTVTFDSTGMMAGDYYANLLIDSNDPDEPTVTVPVQLTVLECGQTMHIGNIWGYFHMDPYGRTLLQMYVTVHDAGHMNLGGVAVDGSIWWPTGGPVMRTRMTKFVNGTARFHWGSNAAGTWQLCVDNLTKAGYTYVPGDNEVPSCATWND
jgi:hypothetical protein